MNTEPTKSPDQQRQEPPSSPSEPEKAADSGDGAPSPTAPFSVNQRFVDRIVARAQNSMMGLGDPKQSNVGAYDLSNYADANYESVALLLVSAHEPKYDLVALMCAAMEEVAAEFEQERRGALDQAKQARASRHAQEKISRAGFIKWKAEIEAARAELAKAHRALTEAEKTIAGKLENPSFNFNVTCNADESLKLIRAALHP